MGRVIPQGVTRRGGWRKTKMEWKVWQQVGASVFYGVTSVLIVMVNKIVLTGYQ